MIQERPPDDKTYETITMEILAGFVYNIFLHFLQDPYIFLTEIHKFNSSLFFFSGYEVDSVQNIQNYWKYWRTSVQN